MTQNFFLPLTKNSAGRPSKDPCACGRDYAASDSPDEDDPALEGPGNGCFQPVFIHYQSRDPFGPKTTRSGGSWELESGRWPLHPASLSCPWDLGNLGTHGEPNREEVDPFQMVNELTTQDIQWRATTRLTSMGLEDVQEFLCLLLENLGSSSRVGRSVPTTGQADPGVRLQWRQELAEEQPNRERRRECNPPPDGSHTGGQ